LEGRGAVSKNVSETERERERERETERKREEEIRRESGVRLVAQPTKWCGEANLKCSYSYY
jgi:hypothetical protein